MGTIVPSRIRHWDARCSVVRILLASCQLVQAMIRQMALT